MSRERALLPRFENPTPGVCNLVAWLRCWCWPRTPWRTSPEVQIRIRDCLWHGDAIVILINVCLKIHLSRCTTRSTGKLARPSTIRSEYLVVNVNSRCQKIDRNFTNHSFLVSFYPSTKRIGLYKLIWKSYPWYRLILKSLYRCHTEYETVHDTKYHPKVNLSLLWKFNIIRQISLKHKNFLLTTIFPSAILRTSQSATRTMQQSTMKSVKR